MNTILVSLYPLVNVHYFDSLVEWFVLVSPAPNLLFGFEDLVSHNTHHVFEKPIEIVIQFDWANNKHSLSSAQKNAILDSYCKDIAFVARVQTFNTFDSLFSYQLFS